MEAMSRPATIPAPIVLVTGATGFVGSHLTRALLARGCRVRALGRDFGRSPNLAAAGAVPVVADLRDGEAVSEACRGVSAVVHAGALSSPWGRAAEFEAVNVGGTANVIAGCRRHGVRRLVYVSSPSVVFDGRDQRDLSDDAPYPRRFVSAYSRTKKEAEDLVNAAARGDVPSVIVRPKAVFGPGDTALLPRLIRAARRGRLPQIGDGQNLVDLTYIDNVVQALLLALDADDAAVGKTYTITNGEHVRLWDVVRQVLMRLDLPTRLPRLPLPAALSLAAVLEAAALVTRREPLLTRYTVAILGRTQTYDISAARRDLGYAPQVSVVEGIERTLAALRAKAPC